jgi:putative membrane protein
MRNSAVMLLFAVAACSPPGSVAAERRDDTTGRRDSVAGVAAASMNDASALGLLRMTHSADSAAGALGASRGSATEVVEFGRMIFREHAALGREAAGVGRDLGVELGNMWDQAYIGYAIAMHEAAMENTARALAASKRPEVRAYIERSVPILQKHLDRAKTLRDRLAKAQEPSTKTP